jgi:hypothetical protein
MKSLTSITEQIYPINPKRDLFKGIRRSFYSCLHSDRPRCSRRLMLTSIIERYGNSNRRDIFTAKKLQLLGHLDVAEQQLRMSR